MSTANRVIKNTGYLYAKMGVTMFISLYTTRLILNSLGATDFGIFNIVGGAIAMLGFLNAAMASATQRFMSYTEGEGNKEKQKSIFNVSVVLHFLIALIVGVVLLIAGYFFFNGILNIPSDRIFAAQVVYGSLIVSTMFTVMTVPYDAVLNAHENMLYYSIVGIVESVLKLSVAFIVVYTLLDKLIVYGILMACIPLITMSIMRVYCHKHYEECIIQPRRYWHKGLMKEMTSFAGWNLFQVAAAVITNSGIGIVINMFFGVILNAAQGIANQICGQLMSLTNILTKAITPVIIKSEGANNREKAIQIANTASKLTFSMTACLGIPALLVMPELLRFWLKEVPEYAVFFAGCQLIIAMCEQLTSGYNSVIMATGKVKNISITKAVIKFAYLPIAYLLFKIKIDITIVYCILVLIQGFLNGLMIPVFFMQKILHYPYIKFLKKVLFPCISAFIIAILMGKTCLLLFDGTISIVITIISSFLLFSISMFILGLNSQEKNAIHNTLVQIKTIQKK